MSNRAALLVDLGNTRLKWASYGDDLWETRALTVPGRDVESLLTEAWGEMPAPGRVVIASVAERATVDAVTAWTHRRWSIPVHNVVASDQVLGVRNCYRAPHTLGADRWAALIGARAETAAGACVIDCGTAVTVDALSAAGEFAGGVILPGVALMRGALARGTAGVRPPDGDEVSCLACATADAVAAGSVYGLAGAIERIAQEFEQALDEPLELLITGGDADRIAARLKRPARRVPDLVLKGLARIADTLC